MSNAKIRIIVVDDHKLIRESWKLLFGNYPMFEVIAECSNGETAIAQAENLVPDIMLVDINMFPINGFEVTKRIMDKIPSIKIIGLSVNNQPRYATRMLELGARGYLTKTSSAEEIMQGILQVQNGELYICEEVRKNMPLIE